MSAQPAARPAPTLIGRVYSAADRAVLPKARARIVQAIASAASIEHADRHAAVALGDAAVWIEQGELSEGLVLIHEAHVAHKAFIHAHIQNHCEGAPA